MGELVEGEVEPGLELGAAVAYPTGIRGERHAKRCPPDRLGDEIVRALAEPPGGKLGDDLLPVGVAEHGMGPQGRDFDEEGEALPEGREIGPVVAVRSDDPAPDGLEDGDTPGRCVELGPQPGQLGAELAPGNVVLGGEIPKERAAPDRGRSGDVVDGRLVVAVLHEQGEGRVLDGLAGRPLPAAELWWDGFVLGIDRAHRSILPRQAPIARLASVSFDTRCRIGPTGHGAGMGAGIARGKLDMDKVSDGIVEVADDANQQLVEDDLLVEEVSIDGMCGVY